MTSLQLITSTFLILLHTFYAEWLRYESEDCPNCVVYTTETNFSSMISFESKVLIGARNTILEVDFLEEISVQYPDKYEPANLETCTRNFGQQVEDCQNYYKVMLPLNKADLFICGTSAFSPVCGVRTISDLSYTAHSNDGIGICPANPLASTTYLKLKDSSFGFAGTERASSSEYAISVINLGYDSYRVMASTKSDNLWLNKPDFIYSFEYGDHVYFVIKEIAVEVMSIEQIYSRVVRICKNDHGGGGPFFGDNFISFVKARIYCSYQRAGRSPYDLNEIGGAYYLDGYLYGIFSGSTSVIETGSVLCRYSMDDISKVFEGKAKYFEYGAFHDEEAPKPFTCLSKRTAQDANRNQLMSGVITSSNPIFYSAVQMEKLVVRRVEISNETSIIAYTGTAHGIITKLGFKDEYQGTVRHRVMRMDLPGPVLGLEAPEEDFQQIFIMSDSWVGYSPLRIPCGHYTTCQTCQTAFPYCGWCSSGTAQQSCTPSADCPVSDTISWLSPFAACPALASFKTKPQDKQVILTETQPVQEIDLSCQSQDPAVKPSWSKLSSQIASTATTRDGGRTLRLRIERYTDGGDYVCSLKSKAGPVEATSKITVLVSPTFAKLSPSNVTVSRGLDVTLTCIGEGHPKPTVTWKLRNGNPLPDSARTDLMTGELKIIRIVPSDSGRYYCEINNNVGSPQVSHDIVVYVTDKNPLGADSDATVDIPEPFGYKKIIIVVCCAIIVLLVLVAIVHFVLKRRNKRRNKEELPQMYPPMNYQEFDVSQSPANQLSPQFIEEQNPAFRGYPSSRPGFLTHRPPSAGLKVQFDWNQAQQLMGQQLLNQQLLGSAMGPGVPYLMGQRDQLQDEPPPAYQAEIELHQPMIPTGRSRMAPEEHFFTPLQSLDSPNATYSPGNSLESQGRYSGGRLSEPGYSCTVIGPPHRGPTPPPRTDMTSRIPNSSLETEPPPSSAEDHADLVTSPPAITSSPPPRMATPLLTDTDSVHEYERIGLLNNSLISAPCHAAGDHDNGSSRGSSLLHGNT